MDTIWIQIQTGCVLLQAPLLTISHPKHPEKHPNSPSSSQELTLTQWAMSQRAASVLDFNLLISIQGLSAVKAINPIN